MSDNPECAPVPRPRQAEVVALAAWTGGACEVGHGVRTGCNGLDVGSALRGFNGVHLVLERLCRHLDSAGWDSRHSVFKGSNGTVFHRARVMGASLRSRLETRPHGRSSLLGPRPRVLSRNLSRDAQSLRNDALHMILDVRTGDGVDRGVQPMPKDFKSHQRAPTRESR